MKTWKWINGLSDGARFAILAPLVAVAVVGAWAITQSAHAQTVEIDGAGRWSQTAASGNVWAEKIVIHTTDQASTITTGSSAIDVDWTPGVKVRVHQINVTLSATGGSVENLDIVLDSGNGAAYDHRLSRTAMNAVQYVNITEDIIMNNVDDVLKLDYNNSNARTYGVEIMYQPL